MSTNGAYTLCMLCSSLVLFCGLLCSAMLCCTSSVLVALLWCVVLCFVVLNRACLDCIVLSMLCFKYRYVIFNRSYTFSALNSPQLTSGVYRYLYWMLIMKKSFNEVPSPLFSFVNGEEDDDDGDVDDQPFSPFWEWILFGTEDQDDVDDYGGIASRGEGENQLAIPIGDGEASVLEYRQPTSTAYESTFANRIKVHPFSDSAANDQGELELVGDLHYLVVRLEELENCWQVLNRNVDIRSLLYEEGVSQPTELDAALFHRKLVRLLLRLDGKPSLLYLPPI